MSSTPPRTSASRPSSSTPASTPGAGGRAAPRSSSSAAAARHAADLGLAVHAGHGLTYLNVGPVAAVAEIEELNIGHSIVSRAVFDGMEAAVRAMKGLVSGASTPYFET